MYGWPNHYSNYKDYQDICKAVDVSGTWFTLCRRQELHMYSWYLSWCQSSQTEDSQADIVFAVNLRCWTMVLLRDPGLERFEQI